MGEKFLGKREGPGVPHIAGIATLLPLYLLLDVPWSWDSCARKVTQKLVQNLGPWQKQNLKYSVKVFSQTSHNKTTATKDEIPLKNYSSQMETSHHKKLTVRKEEEEEEINSKYKNIFKKLKKKFTP